MLTPCLFMCAQGGTFLGPSGQTAVPRSVDQMGGSDTRRRGQRHGKHRAHVGHAGIRPDRKSTHVRRPGGRTSTAADAVQHGRQR